MRSSRFYAKEIAEESFSRPVEEFGQARMPAPPDAAFLERKVGQTFVSGDCK